MDEQTFILLGNKYLSLFGAVKCSFGNSTMECSFKDHYAEYYVTYIPTSDGIEFWVNKNNKYTPLLLEKYTPAAWGEIVELIRKQQAMYSVARLFSPRD